MTERSYPEIETLWRVFNAAHDAVSQTEPEKARRAGFDAVVTHLFPYAEAFRREEARADKLGAEVDELRGAAQAGTDPRVQDLADKIRTATISQMGATRFAVINLLIPESDMSGFADALCSMSSTQNSPPVCCGSLPSGESDPSVTTDYAGGEAISSTSQNTGAK